MLISLERVRELGIMCPCVSKHVPLPTQFHKHHVVPKYLGGTDDKSNLFVLCPTTHYNVHKLLQYYGKHKGEPPGSIRKHYSDFVQGMARKAWEGRRTLLGSSLGGTPIVDPWWQEQMEDFE